MIRIQKFWNFICFTKKTLLGVLRIIIKSKVNVNVLPLNI
jgi:hypothetical protein